MATYKRSKCCLDLPIFSFRGTSKYCKHCYCVGQVQQERRWEQPPQDQAGAAQVDSQARGPPALEAQQVGETLLRGLCWELIRVVWDPQRWEWDEGRVTLETIEGNKDRIKTMRCPSKRVFFLAVCMHWAQFFFPLATRGGTDTPTTVSARENTSGRTGTEGAEADEIQAVDVRAICPKPIQGQCLLGHLTIMVEVLSSLQKIMNTSSMTLFFITFRVTVEYGERIGKCNWDHPVPRGKEWNQQPSRCRRQQVR